MFVEELKKIKECEEKAETIKKQAKFDGRKKLEEAEVKATKIIEEAEAKAKNILDSQVAVGQEEAQRKYNSSMEMSRSEAERLIEKAKANEDKAVSLIAERIVNICGNN